MKFYNMDRPSAHPPLSNVQYELLKVFANDIPEQNLQELKKIMAGYLLKAARDKADAIWDKNGYSVEVINEKLDK